MDQVPDLPKKILKDSWGDDFETYIIKPGEATYVEGKEGGVFIGLKREMIQRAESSLSRATLKKLQVSRAEKKIKNN